MMVMGDDGLSSRVSVLLKMDYDDGWMIMNVGHDRCLRMVEVEACVCW